MLSDFEALGCPGGSLALPDFPRPVLSPLVYVVVVVVAPGVDFVIFSVSHIVSPVMISFSSYPNIFARPPGGAITCWCVEVGEEIGREQFALDFKLIFCFI